MCTYNENRIAALIQEIEFHESILNDLCDGQGDDAQEACAEFSAWLVEDLKLQLAQEQGQ